MGLFKSMKDLKDITKSGKELQKQQLEQQGYGTGVGGQMKQMGDMMSQAKEQLADLTEQQSGRSEILQNGKPGEATILAMGNPSDEGQWFNLHLDLEVHPRTGNAYKIANQHLVPQWAQLAPGVKLPVKIDNDDPAKVAIVWDELPNPAQEGVIRPVGD